MYVLSLESALACTKEILLPMRRMQLNRIHGFSLVGLLFTMVIIVVLFSLLMTSLNKAVTGEGSALQGTVRSVQDEWYLTALFQSMMAHSLDVRGNRYITPSEVSGSGNAEENTTANLFSVMVMKSYTTCRQLISGNEYSGYVQEKTDYDFTAYNAARRMYWDPSFKADLSDLSNVSFAHQPLYGDRFDDHWKQSLSSTFPLLGNRGPKDGQHDPQSFTYGRNGQWGGHLVFGDGHVEYVDTFTPNGITFMQGGETYQDNIFKVDGRLNGGDSVLAFTRKMTRSGPELQWD